MVSSEDVSYGGGTISSRRSSLDSGGDSNMANSLSIPSASQLSTMFSGGRMTNTGMTSDGDPGAFRGSNPTSPVVATTYRALPGVNKAVSIVGGRGTVALAPPVTSDVPPPPAPPEPSFFEEYKTPIVAGGILLLVAAGYMMYKANG